jgi:uncharacterized protein YjbI with pentapeptide repeats
VYNDWRFLRAAWHQTIFAAVVTSLVPVLLVFTISTYPDEWLDRTFKSAPITSTFHRLLFAGEPDEVTGRPSSWFSNRLVLTDQSFVDPDKLEKQTVSYSFRGRDLNYAVLNRADLRKADFTGAKLNQAALQLTKLQAARFRCAETGRESGIGCAELQRANLSYAELQGAFLGQAQLQVAFLFDAELQGAYLSSAHLQGANLIGAQLQGVDLVQGELQGADLSFAQLQGADLSNAQLQGAMLIGAQLQGANLRDARLQGAVFAGALVWRVNGGERTRHSAIASLPHLDLTDFQRCNPDAKPWRDEGDGPHAFTEWRDLILKQIPVNELRDATEKRLSTLDPNSKTPPKVIGRAFWLWRAASPKSAETNAKVATVLADLACSTPLAPHAAHRLIRNATGTQVPTIAERLRKGKSDPTACPGVKGFTDEDWAKLDEVVQQASKQESKKNQR